MVSLKNIKTIVITALVFIAVTMPFREFFSVMEVTEMRPASALPPVLGLMFGFPAALGCAIGNFIADIISGYGLVICLAAFPAQLMYGLIPFAVWNFIKKRDMDESPFFRLKNVKNIIRYILIMAVDSVLMAVMLGLLFKWFGFSPFFSGNTLMVLYNNFVFCMVLGIPIIVFMALRKLKAERTGLLLNERLVLILLLLAVISAGMIGIFAYSGLSRIISDPIAMWNRIYLYVAISLAISFLITVIVLHYAEKTVTIPIESIAGIVKDYIGDGKKKADSDFIAGQCEKFMGNRNETGILAGAFRSLVLDLETYIGNLTKVTAEKERIGAELNVATNIQASMLPCIFPAFPERDEFDIYASMLPAKEVGGDFYDLFLIDKDTLVILVADVSGKGVPAALFMVIAKTLIKNNAQNGLSPKEVFDKVNNLLCANNKEGMFVTAFMGYLDIPSGSLTCVNAGHNPPLLLKDNQFQWIKIKRGLVLGGMEDMHYKEERLTLEKDEIIFLYTDGVTEALNPKNELFSEERLMDAANKSKCSCLKEFTVSMKAEIDAFACGAEQADDITMLAMLYKGSK